MSTSTSTFINTRDHDQTKLHGSSRSAAGQKVPAIGEIAMEMCLCNDGHMFSNLEAGFGWAQGPLPSVERHVQIRHESHKDDWKSVAVFLRMRCIRRRSCSQGNELSGSGDGGNSGLGGDRGVGAGHSAEDDSPSLG